MYPVHYTDRSGSITTGGASQQAAAANESRRFLIVNNKSSNTESIWVAFGTAAVTDSPSIEITPGMIWEPLHVETAVMNVISVTTGTKFTIKEG